MTTSLRASLLALSIAAFPLSAQAAGLGQIKVYSGLGQPLRAEIQVSATPQELQSLNARIASADAFRQANLNYGGAVSAIRVSVDTRASRPVIRLSSDRPINDPFVDLLVELNWATGRMVREYTFLLDPVDIAAPRPLAAAVDTPAAPPAARPLASRAEPARSAPAARAVPESYTVRRGDTMHRIATATAQPGTTLDQMLVALLRANPKAFDGGNINRLRAGSVLSVPSAETVRAIDRTEARRELRAQAADFEAYRRGLATAASTRTPAQPDEAAQESAGRIVPKVDEPAPASESGDQVKVSRSDSGEDAGAEARLHALEEELTSRSKSLEEANQRLAQLERSIRDLQRLLEVQSGTMGQLQAGADGAAPAAPVTATEQLAAEAAKAGETTAPGAVAVPSAPPAVSAQPAESAQPTQPAPAPAAAPAPRPAPVGAPPAQAGFVESMLEDPAVLAGGGGILALLLAYAGLKARQRRKGAEVEAAEAELAASEDGAAGQGVFSGTGGQSVDTGAMSIMHTDFGQTGLSSIDTDEGVDPVAEADVYMAYGRDVQAEEILQDALKADPGRAAIYVKLLEIHAQRKNGRQFEAVASELFARTGGQGREWDKAAALGRKLDPDNPLYGAGREPSAAATQPPTAVGALAAAGAVAAGAMTSASAVAAPAAPVPADEPAGAEGEPRLELSALDFTTAGHDGAALSPLAETGRSPVEPIRSAAEQAPVVEPVTAAEVVEDAPADEWAVDVGTLDFELDFNEQASSDAAAGESPAAAHPALELDLTSDASAAPADDQGVASMVFDLDIGEPEERAAEPVAAPIAAAGTPADPAAELGAATVIDEDLGRMLATGLDFELPDLELDSAADRFDLNATVISDSPLHYAEDEGVSAEGTSAAAETGKGAPPAVDTDATSFDASLLDFDFDLEAQAASGDVPSAAPAGLDLSSIDLELENLEEPAVMEVDAAVSDAQPAAGMDSEEAETKLELARAYEEMGDKEGARELLQEVASEGSARQQAAARDMIARLG